MTISEYKKNLRGQLRQHTVCFLTDGDKVLLGLKKRGFGSGKYLGIGGKVEEHETAEQAARREVLEEIAVQVEGLKSVATLNFYFLHVPDASWDQRVFVFLSNVWKGEPAETEEIRPVWFTKQNLPFDSMWDDAKYWLPTVLDGKNLEADFLYDDTLRVVDRLVK